MLTRCFVTEALCVNLSSWKKPVWAYLRNSYFKKGKKRILKLAWFEGSTLVMITEIFDLRFTTGSNFSFCWDLQPYPLPCTEDCGRSITADLADGWIDLCNGSTVTFLAAKPLTSQYDIKNTTGFNPLGIRRYSDPIWKLIDPKFA